MTENKDATIQPSERARQKLPERAGDTLENVGGYMMLVSLALGFASIFMFGRVVGVETSMFGSQVSRSWSAVNILLILVGTSWSLALSYAVFRLGTALRWLEAIGKQHGITKG